MIECLIFDAGGLYKFKAIHLLLSILISRGNISMMLDSRSGICFGSSPFLTKVRIPPPCLFLSRLKVR